MPLGKIICAVTRQHDVRGNYHYGKWFCIRCGKKWPKG